MKESFWGIAVAVVGVTAIAFVFFFQTLTTTNEHNALILKEINSAAMNDAFDLATYRFNGEIRIDREKYVESFVRRFAQSASLSNNYVIEIYDINESPPKVSVKLSSVKNSNVTGEVINFDISNTLDAILETPY